MAIFNDKDKKEGTAGMARTEGNVSTRGEVHTILGKEAEFEGKLTFPGQTRIDGKFTGTIFTKDTLVIGETARVSAEIVAGVVIINGSVEGNIKATQSIELHTPGRVKGSLETPNLSIDKGVIFEGSCKMENPSGTGKSAAPPAPGTSVS